MRSSAITAALAVVAMLEGCVIHTRASTTVIAADAAVPVSLSEAVRGSDGAVLLPRQLEVVGHYDQTFHAVNLVWGIVRLRPTTDISDSINEAVAAAHGEAVTQLSIVVDGCLGYLAWLWIVPVVPSCARYRIRGNIVRAIVPTAPAVSSR